MWEKGLRELAEAAAVADGEISSVGGNDGARALIGPNTRLTDLNGKLLLPGFHDSHVHLLDGGLLEARCNLTSARTLAQVREHGSDGFVTKADVSQPEKITRLFNTVQSEFGTLDIFVNNARPEVAAFFYPTMDITLEQWDMAFDSQAASGRTSLLS